MIDCHRYRICKCGRTIYGNGVSTVIPKLCPSCQIEDKKDRTKRGVSKKTSNKPNKAKRKTERQISMQLADAWMSRFVRAKNAQYSNGIWVCKCYTCNRYIPIVMAQNGHWQRRGYKKVRFYENNTRVQCYHCNCTQSGKPEIFELNLIKEVGQQEVDSIKKMAFEYCKDNVAFYIEQAEKYQILTEKIMKKKGIPQWWK